MIYFDVKDLLKKPNLYFVIAVGVAVLWLIVASIFFLPGSSESRVNAIKKYKEINDLAKEIYQLDPARIDYAGEKAKVGKFNYSIEIDAIAKKYGIRPDIYDLSTNKPRKDKKQLTQGASMTIKEVPITNVSQFLSEILDKWPGLKCENMKLTADQKKLDTWKVTIKFMYTF